MKKLPLIFCILFIIILPMWIVYIRLTVKISFDTNIQDVAAVEIHTPGVDDLYTEEESEIMEVIKYSNRIRYYKSNNLIIYNRSRDACIALFDREGNIIEKIEYYGYVAVYKGEKFAMMPFTYRKLERLCNRLNKK